MAEEKELKVEDIRKAAEEGRSCPVRRARYYVEGFLAGPMCGRCFPCSMGSYEAQVRLGRIEEGLGSRADLDALKRIADAMLEASMCKKGKDTAKFLHEWLASADPGEHLEGRCPSHECLGLIEYKILPDKCVLCGLCQDACRYNAIFGEKKTAFKSGYKMFEIKQRRCTKCGDCVKVCPVDAIVIVDAREREKVGV